MCKSNVESLLVFCSSQNAVLMRSYSCCLLACFLLLASAFQLAPFLLHVGARSKRTARTADPDIIKRRSLAHSFPLSPPNGRKKRNARQREEPDDRKSEEKDRAT